MRRPSTFTARRLALVATGLVAALFAAACSSAGTDIAVTVISNVTVPVTEAPGSAEPPNTVPSSQAPPATSSAAVTESATSSAAASTTSSSAPGTQPDGFVPKKLAPGEKPPQFVLVSFDGVGWHEKWQYWLGISEQVPFHFTGFLSGTYMLSSETKNIYVGPGHSPGKASISWNAPSDLPVEIADINAGLAAGNEIGTHFNGHFCSGSEPAGNDWNTADWNNELDQFFAMIANVNTNNGISDKLNLDPATIKGGRTPCLEGHAEDLYPAYVAHNMTYDTSFTKRGIAWPEQSEEYKIWQIGMAEVPVHGLTRDDGSPRFQISMDYNFYYTQREGVSTGVTQAESAADSQQVLDTYRDMYQAVYNGNRAPLILGNHFNEWNNNAYGNALSKFVLETCGQPDTQCITYRDLIAWMDAQDPARLADLQSQAPELAG